MGHSFHPSIKIEIIAVAANTPESVQRITVGARNQSFFEKACSIQNVRYKHDMPMINKADMILIFVFVLISSPFYPSPP